MSRILQVALAIALLWAVHSPGAARAEAVPEGASVRIEDVSVGIGGQFKVGHWTPVTVTLAADEPVTGQLVLTTPDGEGLSVRYADADDRPVRLASGAASHQRSVKFGNQRPTLLVEFVVDDAVVARREFPPRELPEGRLSTSEFIVAVGGDIDVRSALRFRPYRHKRTTHVMELDSLADLPRGERALESVDLLVVSTSPGKAVLSELGSQALVDWIHFGGRAVILCGGEAETLFGPGAPLARLAPGEFERVATLRRSAALESYAGSTQRLGTDVRLDQALFKNPRGQVVLSEDAGGEERPLIVHYPVGLGQISLVTVDLDRPPFDDWSGRSRLLARVFAFHQGGETGKGQGNKGASLPAQLGYHDLAGQLRMALDQFPGARLFAFSWLAGLIALYILLIGPADYFLVRYGLRRMQATWLTLALLAVGFTSLAWWLHGQLKSPQLAMNEASVLDIDLASGSVRGTAWLHLYSPATAAYDLMPEVQQFATASAAPSAVVSWQGLPGAGLGGLDGRRAPVLFDSPYSIVGPTAGAESSAVLRDVPIQTASTKAFLTQWSYSLAAVAEPPFHVTAAGLIEGEYVFPFDMKLADCYILYDRFLFRIEGEVKQGRAIVLSDTSESRNLLYHLTQKQVVEAKEIVTPWNPRSTDAARILEVMMLHKAAGGDNYTGLTQRYFAQLDLSDHLATGRALLIGRRQESPLDWRGEPLASAARQQSWNMVRLVLPVALAADSVSP